MVYKNILITGGAGFVGSNLAMKLKEDNPDVNIVSLDNLKRRGSELNIPRLKHSGVDFIHGDIRSKEDLHFLNTDLIIECSAEPSVMAGVTSAPEYLINTNLVGAINCFELARKIKADIIFLSTSRIYPIDYINKLNYGEESTRFTLEEKQTIKGASAMGITEDFPLEGVRSLYGATKLASELILNEYASLYGINVIINRCGVITGPWQFGKIDQGVFVLWVAKHIFKKELSYIGFGGNGKQVRDFLHIDDLYELLKIQLKDIKKFSGRVYNVGGGIANSVSLCELTNICEKVTGNKIKIYSVPENRALDIISYISDYSKINSEAGWRPQKDLLSTIEDIYKWIIENRENLEAILN